MRRAKIPGLLKAIGLVALSLTARGDDGGEDGWSDSLQSHEGIYAFRADAANRRVLVLRADTRGSRTERRRFRIRLERAGSPAILAPLRQAATAEPPWRFGAEIRGWDGVADAAQLEASDDGKHWTALGRFRKR